MRFILFLIFIFFFSFSSGQTKKVINRYNNNSIAAKGKVITCPDYDERYPCYKSTCRKIGKWVYYYQNGNIERVENYKKIKDCGSSEILDGIWHYFNEQGLLIKQEEYKDSIIWTADISKYYFNNKLAGEIMVRSGVMDTVRYMEIDSINLIKNGDFGFYYGQPIKQINDGQNQIESQIPFWNSPDSNTPDYYNQYRSLQSVPDNLNHDYNAIYNYVGIILYHEPTGYYSEYITGVLNSQLTHNRKYCLKIHIRLSQNSGYYIDKIGVHFSKNVPSIPNTIERQHDLPQILFNEILDNRDAWVTHCELYTAIGDEKYITLGRFSGLFDVTTNRINPINQSEGEYNLSAYYLIDKVELLDDTANCICDKKKQDYTLINRIYFDLLNQEDSIELNIGKTYILKNIYFDFDKSVLLPASVIELEKLLTFLKGNIYSITIMGHTDNIGSDEYNYGLSLSRAKAVVDWLIENGIDSKRLFYKGYGARVPIVENKSSENRVINRRVEFKVNDKKF